MGILKPSRKEAWQTFASELGVEFIDDGVFKGGAKVQLSYKTWKILLDTFTISA